MKKCLSLLCMMLAGLFVLGLTACGGGGGAGGSTTSTPSTPTTSTPTTPTTDKVRIWITLGNDPDAAPVTSLTSSQTVNASIWARGTTEETVIFKVNIFNGDKFTTMANDMRTGGNSKAIAIGTLLTPLEPGNYTFKAHSGDFGEVVGSLTITVTPSAPSEQPEETTLNPAVAVVPSDNKYFELAMETDHFKIYCHSQDKGFASNLLLVGEDSIPLLTRVYGVLPNDKTPVYLFATFEEATQLSAMPPGTSPEFSIGGFDTFAPLGDGVKLYISGREKVWWSQRTEVDMRGLMAHETGHRIFYYLYPNIRKPVRPDWLDEGVAGYVMLEVSGSGANGYNFNALVESVKTGEPEWPGLAGLDKLLESSETGGLFGDIANSVIYHIYTSYGEQALGKLLTEYNNSTDLPQAFQKALGVSYSEFEKRWTDWVQDIARRSKDGAQFYELLKESKT